MGGLSRGQGRPGTSSLSPPNLTWLAIAPTPSLAAHSAAQPQGAALERTEGKRDIGPLPWLGCGWSKEVGHDEDSGQRTPGYASCTNEHVQAELCRAGGDGQSVGAEAERLHGDPGPSSEDAECKIPYPTPGQFHNLIRQRVTSSLVPYPEKRSLERMPHSRLGSTRTSCTSGQSQRQPDGETPGRSAAWGSFPTKPLAGNRTISTWSLC